LYEIQNILAHFFLPLNIILKEGVVGIFEEDKIGNLFLVLGKRFLQLVNVID
jgi:hypothetical protein